MSRGLGRKQNAIIRAIQESQNPLSTEVLRWKLEGDASGRQSDLRKSSNSSFQRAIAALAEAGKIELEVRRLQSLRECVDHYPSKTLNGRIRAFRGIFLPALLEWQEDGGLHPKYGIADNEKHHLASLKKSDGFLEPLILKWNCLKEEIRLAYGRAERDSDVLLRLLCKGTELFRLSPSLFSEVQASGSFSQAVQAACGKGIMSHELELRLRDFLTEFVPPFTAKELEFRSLVHEMVEVAKGGPYKLRKQTLNQLHQRRKECVENMDGFRSFEEGPKNAWTGERRASCSYPAELHLLIDRNVFGRFHFVKAT